MDLVCAFSDRVIARCSVKERIVRQAQLRDKVKASSHGFLGRARHSSRRGGLASDHHDGVSLLPLKIGQSGICSTSGKSSHVPLYDVSAKARHI